MKLYYEKGADLFRDCLNITYYKEMLNALELITIEKLGVNQETY